MQFSPRYRLLLLSRSRKWEVYVVKDDNGVVSRVPVVDIDGRPSVDRAQLGKRDEPLPEGLPVFQFKKKSDADGIAWQIGYYILQLGQFKDTWLSQEKA